MSKNLLAVYNLGHACGQCSGIGNPVFVPAVDSRGRETPSFDGGTLLSACGLLGSSDPPKRTHAPVAVVRVVVVQRPRSVDIAHIVRVAGIRRRGGQKAKRKPTRRSPNGFYTLALSRFFHAAIMYFTSRASFDQYSQLFIEIKPISCESSIKNRSSLQ